MLSSLRSSKNYYPVLTFVLFFIAAAASFNGFYDKWHFREPGLLGFNESCRFENIVDGTAERPFVYRQLLPFIANTIDKITPATVKTSIFTARDDNQTRYLDIFFNSPTSKHPAYFFRYIILYIATFFFAFAATYSMHLICRQLGMHPVASVLAPIIMILLIPFFMVRGGYYYDYPELTFFALALWFALKFDWFWLLPIVLLGTFNKESFLLFIPTLYPILRTRASVKSSLAGIALLSIASASVYLRIHSYYAQNPGATAIFHLGDQLRYYVNPLKFLFDLDRTYGVISYSSATLISLLLIAWTLVRAWNQIPKSLQRQGLIAALINLPLYFLFCYPGELRDLSMLYPIFFIALAFNLHAWILDYNPRPTPSAS